MMKRTIGALLGLCGLTGCTEPLTASGYASEYEEALCAWATGCGVFQSRFQCRDSLVWDTTGRFQYLADSAEANRVEFDAATAQVCVDTVASLQCDENLLQEILFFGGPSAAPEPCQDVFVGKVRNYDPCLNSEECKGDNAVCGFSPMCTDACCEGSCRDLGAPPAIGDACTGPCVDGAYCAFDQNTNLQTCAKRRKAGASCGDDSSSCADGLYCDFNGNAVCKKLLAAGANCEGGGECAEGLDCYSLEEGKRECMASPGQGEACSSNNYPECARLDNYCDASNRCAKLAAPGQSCGDYQCMPFAECDYNGGSPTCVARKSLGEDCGPESNYISCIGHLQCGEGERCVEPEVEAVCDVPK